MVKTCGWERIHFNTSKPDDTRHFYIQQDQTRRWIFLAVRISSCASQIFDGRSAVTDNHQPIEDSRFLESEAGQEHIVLIIFSVKNWRVCHLLSVSAGVSSSQKVLPWPGSDSNPTLPPIRAMAFLTMANPMPVPS